MILFWQYSEFNSECRVSFIFYLNSQAMEKFNARNFSIYQIRSAPDACEFIERDCGKFVEIEGVFFKRDEFVAAAARGN